MKKKGLLIVLSGPSGAGKGTICKELLKENKYWLSVSATTRTIRSGEVDKESYYFLTRDQFLNRIEKKDFLEYAEVYGNFYGTPKSNVLEKLGKGEDVILEIDIQGALKVKESYPEGVFIFILPPSMEELKKRISGRGSETPESLMTRFKSAYKEIEYISKYNYAVVNNTVEEAASKIESILVAERCRADRVKEKVFNSEEGVLNERFND